MNYAYLDKYEILHVLDTEQGDRIPTEVSAKGGFPTIEGKQIFMYSLEEMYIGGNRNSFEAGQAKEVNSEDYPVIRQLYIDCKNLKDRIR